MIDKRKEFYKLYKQFDETLPTNCQNCGGTNDLEIHHIVPLISGGNNVIGNLARLCGSCHGRIHGMNANRNALCKIGKRKAKLNNPDWRDGRPKRTLTPEYVEAVKLLMEKSYAEVSELTGISKSTLQRIKRQYKAEQEA